jgi:predicted transcriptional regulator
MLWQLSEVNVSEIARRLGVNHKATITHLKFLEDEGILQHKMFGRIRLYRFNERSPKTVAIQNFFDAWERANKQQKD